MEERERQSIGPEGWALVAVMAAGAALRLWGLGGKSLWIDEARAAWIAMHDLRWITEVCLDPRSHEPPARYYLMHFITLMGGSEALLRLPAFIGGVLFIPIGWALGNALARPPAGLIAATLIALSPPLVEHSQDARYYTLFLLCEFGAMLALLHALRSPRQWPLWAATGLLATLSVYLSYIAVFLAAPIGLALLFLILFPRRTAEDPGPMRLGGAIGLACLAVPYLPWAIPLARAAGKYVGITPEGTAPSGPPPGAEVFWPEWSVDWGRELLHPMLPLGSAVLALALVGGALTWHRNRPGFLLILASLVTTVALVLGTALRHSVNERYLLHLHLFALLLAGVALGEASRRWKPTGPIVAVATVLALAIGAIPALWLHFTNERQAWRPAVQQIVDHIQPQDIIVTGAYWSERPLFHYLPREHWSVVRHESLSDVALLRETVYNPSVWYIGWGPLPPTVQDILDEYFTETFRQFGTEGTVYVWKKGPQFGGH